MRFAYNTNGLAHHRLGDALELLHGLGYEGVAITPDVGQLDLYRLDANEVAAVRDRAAELGLELAVETGARYLLDPRRKHYPTLLEDSPVQRERRLDFLRRSIDLAHELGARACSLWSGSAPAGSGSAEELWERLTAGVAQVLEHARGGTARVCFEPEPGMFVERVAEFCELRRRLGDAGSELFLCLDVGHCLCTGEGRPADVIRETAPFLGHVHLDDIRAGVHEHLMFGEGDLDLDATLRALRDVAFTGLAAVELSRDSHRGAEAARIARERIVAASR